MTLLSLIFHLMQCFSMPLVPIYIGCRLAVRLMRWLDE